MREKRKYGVLTDYENRRENAYKSCWKIIKITQYIFEICWYVLYKTFFKVTQDLLDTMNEQGTLVKYIQDLASVLSLKATQLPGEIFSYLFCLWNLFFVLRNSVVK